MTMLDTPEAVAALLELHAETSILIDRLGADPAAAAAVLADHKLRLRLAEHAVRLAALVDPHGFLDALERSELLTWLHDPTLHRRALHDGGPAEARRLLHAIEPAARLYAAVLHEAARS